MNNALCKCGEDGMSARSIPSGFVTSVLHNGVGRYVCQLQRLTLKFCKEHGNSRGLREFIENHLLDFTHRNPGIVVYLQPRRHRPPKLVAEYLNGNAQSISCLSMPPNEICQWVELLRNQSGVKTMRIRKYWHTDYPSIQGTWTPFTNKDSALTVTKFPDPELSKAYETELTGTNQLLEMIEDVKNMKIVSGDTVTYVETGDTGTPTEEQK